MFYRSENIRYSGVSAKSTEAFIKDAIKTLPQSTLQDQAKQNEIAKHLDILCYTHYFFDGILGLSAREERSTESNKILEFDLTTPQGKLQFLDHFDLTILYFVYFLTDQSKGYLPDEKLVEYRTLSYNENYNRSSTKFPKNMSNLSYQQNLYLALVKRFFIEGLPTDAGATVDHGNPQKPAALEEYRTLFSEFVSKQEKHLLKRTWSILTFWQDDSFNNNTAEMQQFKSMLEQPSPSANIQPKSK